MDIKRWPLITELPIFGSLPYIDEDIRESINLDKRRELFLEALQITSPEEKLTIQKMSPSVKFYVACLVFFQKQVRQSSPNICLGILVTVLKSILVDKLDPSVVRITLDQINSLTVNTNSDKRVKFCGKEIPYDLKIANRVTEFGCIVYHALMLNALLGFVYKMPPQFLDNLFIYKASIFKGWPKCVTDYCNDILKFDNREDE